jgi:hypothetical protein
MNYFKEGTVIEPVSTGHEMLLISECVTSKTKEKPPCFSRVDCGNGFCPFWDDCKKAF